MAGLDHPSFSCIYQNVFFKMDGIFSIPLSQNSYYLKWNFRCASPFLELIDEADASEFVSAMRSLIENMTFPKIYQELTKALLG